jgi:Cu(I)/Ag(I) efflux system membrane fusion protein
MLMSPHDPSRPSDEGPRPPEVNTTAPPSRWKEFRAVVKVVELRLRFVALMAITGLVFGNWDAIWNRYEKWHRPPVERPTATAGAEFFCPMHPGVVRDEPCSCPSCGMSLARRKKGLRPALPDGVLSRVQLTRGQVSMAGVRTVEATYAPLVATLSTVGEVGYDEGRLALVALETRRPVRVDKLHVGSNGVEVRAGQPLAELYNLDLAQAIRDLILARRSGRSGSDEQIRLAIDALKLYGVRQSQIDEILERDDDDYRLPILAPIGGHVVKKNVIEGKYVEEGAVLFEIADLSHVWVNAQVSEDQLAMVRVGQAVMATISAFPGESFAGRVSFVAPFLDAATRSAEARYSLDNPGHRLRPGMSARVSLQVPVAELPVARARGAATRPEDGTAGRSTPSPDEQAICPVSNLKLGAMGPPVAVEIDGRKVWVCCEGCLPKLRDAPARYLARLATPPRGGVLSVPESAVIDSGDHTVVYVEVTPCVFEGRAIVVGPRSGDLFPVLDGLAPGEKVAATGAFLIDAESRINPATRGRADASPAPPAPEPAPNVRSATTTNTTSF